MGPRKRALWLAALRSPRRLLAWPRVFESLRGERHEDLMGEGGRRLAQIAGGSPEAARAFIERELLQRWPATFRPEHRLPGVGAVMDALDAAGVPRAAVSDYPPAAKLAALGLGEGWAAAVDCSALGALKPLPDGLLAAAAAMGVAPEQVVHVGDREDTDGEMAARAGAVALIRGRDYRDAAELRRLLLGPPPGAP